MANADWASQSDICFTKVYLTSPLPCFPRWLQNEDQETQASAALKCWRLSAFPSVLDDWVLSVNGHWALNGLLATGWNQLSRITSIDSFACEIKRSAWENWECLNSFICSKLKKKKKDFVELENVAEPCCIVTMLLLCYSYYVVILLVPCFFVFHFVQINKFFTFILFFWAGRDVN